MLRDRGLVRMIRRGVDHTIPQRLHQQHQRRRVVFPIRPVSRHPLRRQRQLLRLATSTSRCSRRRTLRRLRRRVVPTICRRWKLRRLSQRARIVRTKGYRYRLRLAFIQLMLRLWAVRMNQDRFLPAAPLTRRRRRRVVPMSQCRRR
ncbi:hypothetical protein A5756_07080 [Mycobacterium sp. 852002-53434_SCH5985345]|nr:hypothetical protein A5756_07080 [Mycobacterium sp. 852002-53434_SCH5985345]